MKKILILSVILFLGIFNLSFAQNKEEGKTLLWKVSNNKGERSSYLFGTYHMLCEEDFEIKNKVKKALGESDEIVMEINFNDPKEMQPMQGMLIAQEPITKSFNGKQIEEFKSGLKNYGYNLSDVEKLSPMFLYSLLITKFFDCEPHEMKMPDMELMKIAVEADKKVIGLETVSQQAKFFDEYLKPDDILKLVKNFDFHKKAAIELQKVYIQEDLDAIAEAMKDPEQMSKEQYIMLLDNRNKKWMDELPQIIDGKSVFIAVGAGHLTGESGLIKLFREKGYRVEPVFE